MKPAKKRGSKGNGVGVGEGIQTMNTGNLVPLSGAIGGVEVLSVDETHANTVHIRLLELKHQYESTYFEMSRLLYEVMVKRLFRAKSCGGHETFEQYVEHELDFGLRKAQQLANIWWWYGIQQGAEPKLLQGAHEIGWTKAALLVKVVDPENADRWFSIAKTTNTKSLAEQTKIALKVTGKTRDTRVSDKKANPPKTWPQNQDEPSDHSQEAAKVEETQPSGVEPPSPEQIEQVKKESDLFVKRLFNLEHDQSKIVGQAISWAKKIGANDSDNLSITLICQHFLSFVHDKETVMTGEWLAKFERMTGLKVIAVDPRKENEVVYGHEYLCDLPEEEENVCQEGDSSTGA